MINLNSYKEDPFSFFAEVVAGKKNSAQDKYYKNRLNSLTESVKLLYEDYDLAFQNNTLQYLECCGFTGDEKEDLLKLYSFRAKAFQELKIKLTTIESNRIISTCQNCTIGEISSFDHIVPKSEFAEFAIHPKNLFPSCSKCNEYKSISWRDNNKRLFLNLYLDKLPKDQYLFVKLNCSDSKLEIDFYIDNINGIDDELFSIIEYHYQKLRLCERFKENSDLVVTNLINSLQSAIKFSPLDIIIRTSDELSRRNQKAFGSNYWRSILEISLVSFEPFLRQFVLK
ncbi:HNH endonuclease [Rufibacter quisquiliarum]|uniref:HNH domain-containing protein n=1 Tax=Rufibacter quisquiliarum TaxID=1549639 RepID=A0A839GQL1_9BACT|nr:HNH endonuclease [Rufibacter quisquiliarum]MBA9077187.1 hypothetical protein [Rufibacter quisquiliarum]